MVWITRAAWFHASVLAACRGSLDRWGIAIRATGDLSNEARELAAFGRGLPLFLDPAEEGVEGGPPSGSHPTGASRPSGAYGIRRSSTT